MGAVKGRNMGRTDDEFGIMKAMPMQGWPPDPINHPPHYNQGRFECIDVIEDWNLGYHLGCAVKYIARCQHKGSKKEDLLKAIWYLQREVDKG